MICVSRYSMSLMWNIQLNQMMYGYLFKLFFYNIKTKYDKSIVLIKQFSDFSWIKYINILPSITYNL